MAKLRRFIGDTNIHPEYRFAHRCDSLEAAKYFVTVFQTLNVSQQRQVFPKRPAIKTLVNPTLIILFIFSFFVRSKSKVLISINVLFCIHKRELYIHRYNTKTKRTKGNKIGDDKMIADHFLHYGMNIYCLISTNRRREKEKFASVNHSYEEAISFKWFIFS